MNARTMAKTRNRNDDWSQNLPSAGSDREQLREKGQFWTPLWLAKVMASWVTQGNPAYIFDPAVGPGTFFSAARKIGFRGAFRGNEIHAAAFEEGATLGLLPADFMAVRLADFISDTSRTLHPAIISNPPYIRHHRLGLERKAELKSLADNLLGFTLDGRTGLHLYFLLKCLAHLQGDGRLAFLLPADVCEGLAATSVWQFISSNYRIEFVLTFDKGAAPFPQVDTNAMVFLISKRPPVDTLKWVRVLARDDEALTNLLVGRTSSAHAANVIERQVEEAVSTGLSRPPKTPEASGQELVEFARVVRGIATGANDFFFLASNEIEQRNLDKKFFIRALGRTRDASGEKLTEKDLDRLDALGRATYLLNLDGTPIEKLPQSLQDYIKEGESRGLHLRSLIAMRRPWYKMEVRKPPELLFAYLGRRDCRFILNLSGAVPLTGFLCVYANDKRPEAVERLWRALNDPRTLANLSYVGKSYGGGALKVEPRQLDRLHIPDSVIKEFNLVINEGVSASQ